VSTGTNRFIKGTLGVVVVLVLLVMVSNWWGDYKREAARQPEKTATSTVESTKTSGASKATTASVVVVLIDGLNFRKKPAADAATIRGLKKGEKLALVSKAADWYQVKDSKGTVGYVAAKPQYVRVEQK